MKILVVTESKHQGNTLKIANAMAEAAPVTVTDVKGAGQYDFNDYDIVGFGSGIYYGKFDKDLTALVEGLCDKKAYTFVFSTSGSKNFKENNASLINILKRKNKIVLDSFGCTGYDKFFLFKIIGGLNKGHPDGQDLKEAQNFIANVIKNYEALEEK